MLMVMVCITGQQIGIPASYLQNVTLENNTSNDCEIRFMVWFNGTWGVGEYNYQSILSNGETYNGTIIVTEDVHVEEPMPGIGNKIQMNPKLSRKIVNQILMIKSE